MLNVDFILKRLGFYLFHLRILNVITYYCNYLIIVLFLFLYWGLVL